LRHLDHVEADAGAGFGAAQLRLATELAGLGTGRLTLDANSPELRHGLDLLCMATGTAGWVVTFEESHLELTASCGESSARTAKELSSRVQETANPVMANDEGSHWLALPIASNGTLAGAIVLSRDAQLGPIHQNHMAMAASFAARLSMAIERHESQDKLETQISRMQNLENQLENYALDLRTTYTAERTRAEELSQALDELESTYLATVKGFAVAVEAKDAYTAGHIARVTEFGLLLLELIDAEEVTDPQYEYAFLLHDIGKLSVPDSVLGKNGPLTDEEWKVMRRHPEVGKRILQGIPFLSGALEIVFAHHERWDGNGYPRGLAEKEIPLGARVFNVVDTFDAMTSDRPYRKGVPIETALGEIEKESHTQFWPAAVEAFLTIPADALEEVRQGPSQWAPRNPEVSRG
jgi:HD-GYP domain-containing protein (c-di-GMP phosphodiesterase class II)